MSILQNFAHRTRKLWLSGVLLRCPNCEQGRVFRHLFRIEPTCEVCHVRFERMDGESIGGMAITMAIVPPLSLVGFFVGVWLFKLPLWINTSLGVLFILLACTFIYRHSRAAWVAVSYLTGGVYADEITPPQTVAAQQRIAQASKDAQQPHTPEHP